MSTEITIEELAADIEEQIGRASRGETVVILKDGEAVATVGPPPDKKGELLFAQRADRSKRLGDFKPTGLGRRLDVDVVQMIREDRDKRRSRISIHPSSCGLSFVSSRS